MTYDYQPDQDKWQQFETVVYSLSREMVELALIAEEEADLELARTPLTGFELDAIEAFRRELDVRMDRALLFGS